MKHVLLIFVKHILLLVIIVIILLSNNGIKADPRAIIYKGKVNIGLLIAAHLSNSSQLMCDTINFNGLHNAMATVWSLHMFNQRQRLSNSDEIGVFIYDTCDDLSVAKRQTVRMISHLHSFGNRICREGSKGYPPLIGVIAFGHTFDASLDLLSSFGVPIITTSRASFNNDESTTVLSSLSSSSDAISASKSNRIFSVAPTLQYLAKAVISFVKYLDWQSVSLVISDEEPSFDRKYLLSLAREGRFAIVKNYNNFDATAAESSVDNYPNEDFAENYSEKLFSDFGSKRIQKRDEKLSQQSSSLPASSSISTIFFLSTSEAIHLLTNLIGNEGQYRDDSHASNYNNAWIIATLDDLTSHLQSANFLKRKPNLKRNIFLVSPAAENTTEYQQYFEAMVKNFGGKTDQPFLADYSQTKKGFTVPNISVSSMVKAVWVLAEAYQNLRNKECKPGIDCKLSTNNNITNMMVNSLRTLNTTIDSSGHKQIDGFRLNFDALQQLTSWKFQLKLLSPNGNLINVGSYSDETGLSLNTRLLNSIKNRQSNTRRIKFTTKSPSRIYPKAVIPATLASLGSSNMPVFKQAVYGYHNSHNSNFPFSSLRSSVRQQTMSSMASSPMGKLGVIQQTVPTSSTQKPPPVSDTSQVTRKKQYGLTSWLGNLWSMIILGVCILGILITLYVQTFLLMKSCEGALRKSNQGLVMFHLIAVMSTFLGSALYVFYPSSMMCSVRNSVHNLALSLLFGSLLLRAMHIRSQKSIGLGGRTSRINQFLTLIFIVGIQAALEFQRWKYESPWKMTKIKSVSDLPKLCSSDGTDDYIKSQIYLTIILMLMLVMSWSARNTPFNQREGTQVLIVSFVTIIIFIVSNLSTINITRAKHRDVVISLSMNGHAFVVLIGIFVPLLYTIHKYGAILAKPSSYADSLSTIFTTFNGNRDLDNVSHNSNDSRNSGRGMIGGNGAQHRSHKLNKHRINESTNFFARVSPTHYMSPYDRDNRQTRANLVANPLYEGVPGFRSAYP